MKHILPIILLMACCSTRGIGPTTGEVDRQLADKHNLYIEGSESFKDSEGFTFGHVGDSMLFSCLNGVSGVVVEYWNGVLEDGRPLRHPNITEHDSSTSWSKDMMVGYLVCLYTDPDKERARELIAKTIEYGRAHLWNLCGDKALYKEATLGRSDMGSIEYEAEYLSRCVMSPTMIYVAHKLSTHLGNDCNLGCRAATAVKFKPIVSNTGFRRHLDVVTILLIGLLEDGVTKRQLAYLKKATNSEKNNALYSAVYHKFYDGNFARAKFLLRDTSLWPTHRLPSYSRNFCTDYLYQRDEIRVEKFIPVNGCITFVHPSTQTEITECDLNSETTRTVYNRDWLTCGKSGDKNPISWIFTYGVITTL
jgi:hypothetical protein